MIDLTRRKRLKLNIDEIDFKKLINECVDGLSSMDNAHKLNVNIKINGEYPFFNDIVQVGSIITNLVSNSVKFQHVHELNPQLKIEVTVAADKAIMLFHDNGVGIPEDEITRIFDMFFQGRNVHAEGSGLGLYVVKEIVKKLKGKIYVDSEKGEGSLFQIELPNKIDPDFLRKFERLKKDAD